MSKSYLDKNEELHSGDSLVSNNGEWTAVFQDDSNFVIYGRKAVWATATDKWDGVRLCMQADCNLVMYNKFKQPRWSTDTCQAEAKCRLQLTDDGKLVLYREGEEIWSSDDPEGKKK